VRFRAKARLRNQIVNSRPCDATAKQGKSSAGGKGTPGGGNRNRWDKVQSLKEKRKSKPRTGGVGGRLLLKRRINQHTTHEGGYGQTATLARSAKRGEEGHIALATSHLRKQRGK